MSSDHPINSTVSVHLTRAIPPGLLGHVVAEGQKTGQKAIVRTREIAWGEPRPVEDYIVSNAPRRGHRLQHPQGYQPPHQGSGCLQVLAVIGFLAICAACLVLGIVLAGNL